MLKRFSLNLASRCLTTMAIKTVPRYVKHFSVCGCGCGLGGIFDSIPKKYMINCKKYDNTAYTTTQYFTSTSIMAITKVVEQNKGLTNSIRFFMGQRNYEIMQQPVVLKFFLGKMHSFYNTSFHKYQRRKSGDISQGN